jgi:hypothetical protein
MDLPHVNRNHPQRVTVVPKTLAGQTIRCMNVLIDLYRDDHTDPHASETIRHLRGQREHLASLIAAAGEGKLSAPTALLVHISRHLEAGANRGPAPTELTLGLRRTAARLRLRASNRPAQSG